MIISAIKKMLGWGAAIEAASAPTRPVVVSLEDIHVDVLMDDGSVLPLDYVSNAIYSRYYANRPNGICVRDTRTSVENFFADWAETKTAFFGNQIVRFDKFVSANMTVTKRNTIVMVPEDTDDLDNV